MKYFLLTLILFSTVCISYSQSPLVITRENFNITASIDTLFDVGNLDGIINPEEGTNKIWNYSKIDVSIKNIQTINCKIPVDPFFDKSTCWFPDNFDIIAGERGIYYDDYSYLTDDSYSFIGIGVKEQKYYIGDLTNNVNDSIIFPAQHYKYANSRYVLKFPTTYGTVTKSELTKSIDFQLSLGIFSLNHAPCKKVTHITQIDSVVGWGTLIVPNIKITKGKSTPNNVLLIKRYYTTVDSMFLNGEPAPATLMAAFSLTQGYKVNAQRYMFMREDSKVPLLSLNYGETPFTTLQTAYFDINTDLSTSVEDNDGETISSKVFPNPSSVNISIEMPQQLESNIHISISDINGNEVLQQDLSNSYNINKYDIKLPENIINGSYLFKICNSSGKILSKGKFLVVK